MFGPRIQQYARRIAEVIVSPLAAIGMTPNMATLLGLLLNAVAAGIIASGSLRLGGLMLLFAGLFDMVDGALARVRNQKTTFGAFLDSTLDRCSGLHRRAQLTSGQLCARPRRRPGHDAEERPDGTAGASASPGGRPDHRRCFLACMDACLPGGGKHLYGYSADRHGLAETTCEFGKS